MALDRPSVIKPGHRNFILLIFSIFILLLRNSKTSGVTWNSEIYNQVNPIDLMKTLREDLKLKEVQGVEY